MVMLAEIESSVSQGVVSQVLVSQCPNLCIQHTASQPGELTETHPMFSVGLMGLSACTVQTLGQRVETNPL